MAQSLHGRQVTGNRDDKSSKQHTSACTNVGLQHAVFLAIMLRHVLLRTNLGRLPQVHAPL